ncbi:unnamed protein product [Durusdinium trenchii]|uniref:ABC transporter domain-containing protein n=1 Tax=Durusdinium trenchii TaxID=1381693 RepID=A0ABP0PRS7_9DINO
MIERLGGEVARATTVVSFQPNASFPMHQHVGGEEFIVLQGAWFDDWNTQPQMTYVRNYIGSKHTPRIGPEGCTILVKLCQMSEKHHEPDHSQWDISSSNPQWRRSGASGPLELRVFQSPLEEVHFERWSPGQRGTVEVPKDGEEVFVIEGSFSDEMGEHRTWSWCRNAGERHARLTRVAGAKGCLLYIKSKHLNSHEAQSRMKMLTKLQEEAVAVDYDDPYLQLEFPAASTLPPPCISVIEAGFGYTPDRILYQNLDFGVDCDSRVAIVGPNGAGKSTFLKLLDGSLEPTNGFVRRHAKLQLARSESLANVADLVAQAVKLQSPPRGHRVPVDSSREPLGGGCCFYGWVIVAVCILCKIFKVQGQNNVMSYTVPHLLEDFQLSHSELGGLFSVATIFAGMAQPALGRTMDRFGGRVCIPIVQLAICGTLLAFGLWQRPEDRLALRVEVIGVFFFLRMLCLGAGEIFPNACVQQWFKRRRGRAVGVVFTFQWLGNAVFGTVIAGIVANYSWHTAALLGATANLFLAPLSALLLRRSPEVCGLLPDGWAAIPEEEEAALKETTTTTGEVQETSEISVRRFWAHFVFTFFYALMFGGCDFYMMEMVAEATVGVRDVSVPLHVFAPLALSSSVSIPVVGELMDAYSSRKTWLPSFLLAVAGVLTASVTSGLTSIQSWPTAVLCGAVRGITSGIFQSLLSAGLAFLSLGVSRKEIGRVLGYNQFCTLVGTGVGPLWYGTSRDLFGSFKVSLWRLGGQGVLGGRKDSDAVTHMRKLGSGGIKEDGTSEVTVEEARKYLGRFGLHGDLALQPVKFLSGGQKSRLAFAELAWSSPHIMLLDEPTNHLDLETIEGLAMALNKFEGGVVLVSHDDRLVSMVADELWVVTPGPSKDVPGKVTVFEGSFEEYREMLRSDFINKHLTSGGRIKRKA